VHARRATASGVAMVGVVRMMVASGGGGAHGSQPSGDGGGGQLAARRTDCSRRFDGVSLVTGDEWSVHDDGTRRSTPRAVAADQPLTTARFRFARRS